MTMHQVSSLARRFRDSIEGAMVIETAVVLPMLVMMTLGIYDAGRMFERQTYLQSAIGQATAITLAAGSGATTDINTVKSILVNSSGLPASQITVVKKYRCGDDPTLLDSSSSCTTGEEVSTYLDVNITDSYSPVWTDFGIGQTIHYNVTRTAQIA